MGKIGAGKLGLGRAESNPYLQQATVTPDINPYATPQDVGSAGQGNPMQAVVDAARGAAQGQGQPLTLDLIVQTGLQQGLTAPQIANMQGLQNAQGITFTDTGLNALAAANGGQALDVNMGGADISGAVFHPESCFEGIIIDEATVGAEAEILADKGTKMQFVTLTDFSQQADINLKGDVSFLSIDGTRNQGAKQPNITFEEGTTARGMDMEGAKLAKLHVGDGSDLTGLKAAHSSAIEVAANGVLLNGADFSGSSVSENSAITNSELVGAKFNDIAVFSLDLTGSNCVGAEFKNVEMANVTLDKATIRAQDFIGSKYNGTEITADNLQEMLGTIQAGGKANGLNLVEPQTDITLTIEQGRTVTLPADMAVGRVEQSLGGLQRQREAGPNIPQVMDPPTANVALDQTDLLIDMLAQTMALGRAASGTVQSASLDNTVSTDPSLGKYRVEPTGPSMSV